MRKIIKGLGILVGVVVLVVAGFAIWVQVRGIPTYDVPVAPAVAAASGTPAQLELGHKIVQGSCADCHINKQTNSLAGQQLPDITEDFGAVYSANITQDKEHGIGNWTDQQLVTLLRTGIGPDGRYRLIMPHFVYMSDEDVAATLAFLRSNHEWVKPSPAPSHEQKPSFLLKALTNVAMKPTPVVAGPQVAPPITDKIAYGRYLVVGRYQCFECHSKAFKTNDALHPEQSEGYLGGGNELMNQQRQLILSRNITSDAETGIGDWTEAQFAQAIKFGMSPNGPLHYPMPKYSTLSDEEVGAIYAYLQSVPKLKNATPEDGKAIAANQ